MSDRRLMTDMLLRLVVCKLAFLFYIAGFWRVIFASAFADAALQIECTGWYSGQNGISPR